MKENMPGNGHRQTDGYVDRGPRRTRYQTQGVFTKRVFNIETFDTVYKVGKFPEWIRNQGWEKWADEPGESRLQGHRGPKVAEPYRVDAMGQAGTARHHYTTTLREFFGTRIDQLSERDREHVNSIMKGQSTRDSADELGISQPAVVTARQRAIKRLVALIGTSNKDVANELVFYLKSEGGVALAGRLPDRVLAQATVWRGHE